MDILSNEGMQRDGEKLPKFWRKPVLLPVFFMTDSKAKATTYYNILQRLYGHFIVVIHNRIQIKLHLTLTI